MRTLVAIAMLTITHSTSYAAGEPMQLGGTLVVAVPNREGLVVAADSRLRNETDQTHWDNGFKLVEIEPEPARTVAGIAGVQGAFEVSGLVPAIGDQIRTRLALLPLFKTFIEKQRQPAQTIDIAQFPPALRTALRSLPGTALRSLQSTRGTDLLVASFDPETSISWVRFIKIGLIDPAQATVNDFLVHG
jgi:hypothetical protein